MPPPTSTSKKNLICDPMDIETLNKANKLRDEIELVADVIEAIDAASGKNQDFRFKLSKVVLAHKEQFKSVLIAIHDKYQEEFDNLHCSCPPTEDGDETSEPEPPTDETVQIP